MKIVYCYRKFRYKKSKLNLQIITFLNIKTKIESYTLLSFKNIVELN